MFTPRPENVELSLYEPYGCYSYGCQLDLAIPWSGVSESPNCKGSPSKNPDIKTPLVVSFSLEVIINFSPLAAF